MARKRRKHCSKDVYTELECKRDARTGKTVPRCKLPGNPGVCFRIRKEPALAPYPFISEVISTKTGKSVGYIGMSCTLVKSRDLARRTNVDNTFGLKTDLADCLNLNEEKWRRAEGRKFRQAVKEAERKAAKQ